MQVERGKVKVKVKVRAQLLIVSICYHYEAFSRLTSIKKKIKSDLHENGE